MRWFCAIVIVRSFVAAYAATVSLVPSVPEWTDCEAATNAALPVATWQRRGHFDVRLSVAAGTNLLQVAFGRDADGDGELSHEETALVVGRGADEVFFEDVAERRRYVETLPPPAFCFDPSWDTVRVVSAGPDDADGQARVEIAPDGTVFIMR